MRCSTLAGILCCSSAIAQVRYCIGGDLDHLTQAQKVACNAKAEAVRTAVNLLQIPDNWHFVVVCGEQGWKDYTAYATASGNTLQGSDVSTDATQRETFFREASLHASDTQAVERLVAGELGKIKNTPDHVAEAPSSYRIPPSTADAGGL